MAEVCITILDVQGQTLQQGEAAQVKDAWWEFETASEGEVVVEAFDLAGNCTRHEA